MPQTKGKGLALKKESTVSVQTSAISVASDDGKPVAKDFQAEATDAMVEISMGVGFAQMVHKDSTEAALPPRVVLEFRQQFDQKIPLGDCQLVLTHQIDESVKALSLTQLEAAFFLLIDKFFDRIEKALQVGPLQEFRSKQLVSQPVK
jgi:hypothetical protein